MVLLFCFILFEVKQTHKDKIDLGKIILHKGNREHTVKILFSYLFHFVIF